MVRGPNVCVGLFDDPEREQRIFTADGWLRTGDVGVLDDDGYLAIVGRTKEIIIRGGINVAPREIEDLIMEMPGVRAVAVVGVPDERLGEIGCACVVADEPLELDDVVAHLRSRDLATYKLPRDAAARARAPDHTVGQDPQERAPRARPGRRVVIEAVSVEDVALPHGTARVLTLQRPDERNPLDHATVARLRALLEDADADPAIRVVIITGAGPAFSAGGDLRAYIDLYRHDRAFRAFLDEFRGAERALGARPLREHRDGERRVRGRRARARARVRPDHHRRRRPHRRRPHPHRPDRRRRRQPAPRARARRAAREAAAAHRAPVVGRRGGRTPGSRTFSVPGDELRARTLELAGGAGRRTARWR